MLLGHSLHHAGTPGVSTLSKLGVYGFKSNTGVLSFASIKVTRIIPLLKSMLIISDVVKAIGLGRTGDLVAKTPITVEMCIRDRGQGAGDFELWGWA